MGKVREKVDFIPCPWPGASYAHMVCTVVQCRKIPMSNKMVMITMPHRYYFVCNIQIDILVLISSSMLTYPTMVPLWYSDYNV